MERSVQELVTNMGLHNLTTDDWAEQISPSVFDENAVDDEENEEYLTEEE